MKYACILVLLFVLFLDASQPRKKPSNENLLLERVKNSYKKQSWDHKDFGPKSKRPNPYIAKPQKKASTGN